MRDNKLKPRQVESPSCLPAGQVLRRLPILEVLVVRLNLEHTGKSLKVMAPGLQSTNDSEHLFVVDLVVAFCIAHRLRVKSNGVPFTVLPLLRQNCASGEPRCIDFNTGFAVWVVHAQDRAFGEATLELIKG